MGLRLMCVAGVALVALLLLLTAAIMRLSVLLIQLVTLRYSLAICALALSCWFVDSRRHRYAKGFYSCSRVPCASSQEQTKAEEEEEEEEIQEEVAATVSPAALPVQMKKVATAPPSETESEDEDSEASGPAKAPPASAPSRHNKSLADVRIRSNTTDGEMQRRQATRPRSSSAVGDSSRSSTRAAGRTDVKRSSNADVMERKRRRRADTGMVTANKPHKERSRRATVTSKQDAMAASSRSNSEVVEDAMRSDGYWIGDFRVQRRLVPRRSHASSPKGN